MWVGIMYIVFNIKCLTKVLLFRILNKPTDFNSIDIYLVETWNRSISYLAGTDISG